MRIIFQETLPLIKKNRTELNVFIPTCRESSTSPNRPIKSLKCDEQANKCSSTTPVYFDLSTAQTDTQRDVNTTEIKQGIACSGGG